MMRFFLHVGVCVALLATASIGPLALENAAGDTNGDSTVDVLDLQRVIADVLEGGATATNGDVNADGRVDVLDFQALLGQAQAAVPAPGSVPTENKRGTTVTTRSVEIAFAGAVRVKTIAPEEGKSASALGARPAREMHMASVKTERHRLNLSPNAPPTLG